MVAIGTRITPNRNLNARRLKQPASEQVHPPNRRQSVTLKVRQNNFGETIIAKTIRSPVCLFACPARVKLTGRILWQHACVYRNRSTSIERRRGLLDDRRIEVIT